MIVHDRLTSLIKAGSMPPYVYRYPTRSSYRQLETPWTWQDVWREDEGNSPTLDLNLYIHVPFCHYKCGFCNLYTVVSKDKDVYELYVDALIRQLNDYAPVIQG